MIANLFGQGLEGTNPVYKSFLWIRLIPSSLDAGSSSLSLCFLLFCLCNVFLNKSVATSPDHSHTWPVFLFLPLFVEVFLKIHWLCYSAWIVLSVLFHNTCKLFVKKLGLLNQINLLCLHFNHFFWALLLASCVFILYLFGKLLQILSGQILVQFLWITKFLVLIFHLDYIKSTLLSVS